MPLTNSVYEVLYEEDDWVHLDEIADELDVDNGGPSLFAVRKSLRELKEDNYIDKKSGFEFKAK